MNNVFDGVDYFSHRAIGIQGGRPSGYYSVSSSNEFTETEEVVSQSRVTDLRLLTKLIDTFEEVRIELDISIPEERAECQLNQKGVTEKFSRSVTRLEAMLGNEILVGLLCNKTFLSLLFSDPVELGALKTKEIGRDAN